MCKNSLVGMITVVDEAVPIPEKVWENLKHFERLPKGRWLKGKAILIKYGLI